MTEGATTFRHTLFNYLAKTLHPKIICAIFKIEMADVPTPQNTEQKEKKRAPTAVNNHFPLIPWSILMIVLVIAVVAIVSLPNLLKNNTATPTPMPSSKSGTPTTLVIGTDATYPPMESVDEEGTLVGYDIDLGNKLAENLGLTAEFNNIAWDDLFPALLSGDIDVIISGVTINEQRQKLYDFTAAYLNAGQVIITQEQNTTIESVDDLAGKIIAVQGGTTNQTQALKYTSTELVKSFDNFEDATEALVAGQADAIFSDLTNAKGIVEAHSTLKIASAPFTSEYYGIVVRKGESDLVGQLNSALEALRKQGYLVFLQQKWLE
ncbi:basic amino acid ABC transporter substrate-binding protein [candidate division WWE3 bacterium]|uniref:Basic amino acid ABC transporter substrate-binding protein n=1 Tax=candidate division WWE3 bacterium TaxID=2053526 RepID=A0A955LJQ1_UNCKA|nr:basic amino acid ABC transporter substrate-binding protein [candidate division WWE3 bacterium]